MTFSPVLAAWPKAFGKPLVHAYPHDRMDASELLPEEAADRKTESGPDYTNADAVADAFNQLFTELMTPKNFLLDCLGENPIAGYDTSELWNGWGCPLFSCGQAKSLVAAWKARGWAAHYDEAADAFVFSINQDLESDEFETFHAVEHAGIKYYPIGSGSWVWDAEGEADDVPAVSRSFAQ